MIGHINVDTFRVANAWVALGIVFTIGVGLTAGWRYMITWRWFALAVLIEHGVLAAANLDASRDALMPHQAFYLPARVVALFVANMMVLTTGFLATVLTIRGDLTTPAGHTRK